VLTTGGSGGEVDFYLHRADHQLSQFPPPDEPGDFERVRLPAVPLRDLIARHGAPWYFKTDVEYFDAILLKNLFSLGFRPPLVSAEHHGIEVFATLVADGGYNAFRLVNQENIARKFRRHPVMTRAGDVVRLDFQRHSTGPFGDDLPGSWMDGENFFRLLACEDLSWADIHATNLVPADPAAKVSARELLLRLARLRLHRLRNKFA
jgi:hypothetical protein